MPFSELPELAKIAATGMDNPNVETLMDALPAEAHIKMLPER